MFTLSTSATVSSVRLSRLSFFFVFFSHEANSFEWADFPLKPEEEFLRAH